MFDTAPLPPAAGHGPGAQSSYREPAETLARALRAAHGDLDAEALLEVMIRRAFPASIALVSAFGAESAVLLEMVARVDRATPVIFIDTGKLFPETLACRDALAGRLGLKDLRTIGPGATAVAARDSQGTLWRRDPDACCHLRKVAPLEAALAGFYAWITGRKRYQGGERAALETIEAAGGRVKINPLAHWTRDDVDGHIAARDLPRHPLAWDGFASIGCQPCTRRAALAEAVREGRWPGSGKTECGIHGARRGSV